MGNPLAEMICPIIGSREQTTNQAPRHNLAGLPCNHDSESLILCPEVLTYLMMEEEMVRVRLISTTGLDDALVKNDLWGMCSFGAHDWLSLTVMSPSSGQVHRLNLALLYLTPT